MGHGDDHSGGVEAACSRVLPIIDEESESEIGEGSPERKVDDRRKAIVSRMRELLRRAAAQSAHSKLRSTVLVSAKKWKRVVASARKHRKEQQVMVMNIQSDGGVSSSPASSKNSFSWDIAAEESCWPSPRAQSPLWPGHVVPAAGQFSPSPGPSPAATDAMGLRRDSSGSATDDRMSLSTCSTGSPRDDDGSSGGGSRMCQWITTDSDFVVLEL